MHKLSLAFCLLLLLWTGCDRNTLMHSYQPLSANEWDRGDTLRFTLPTISADENYSLVIGLRITDDYPYERLVFQVKQDYQNPSFQRVDTIFYQLTDKAGNFTKGGVNYFQYETESLPMELKKGQKGEVRIRHLMHREVLPGIMDVGIHIIR